MTASFRIENSWHPDPAPAGRLIMTLVNLSAAAQSGFTLCYTSISRVVGTPEFINGRFLMRDASYHEIAPPEGFALPPGASWTVEVMPLNRSPFHVTDGLKTAFLRLSDGTLAPVETGALALSGRADPPPAPRLPPGDLGDTPFSLTPWPADLSLTPGPTPLALYAAAGTPADALRAIAQVSALHARLYPTARQVLSLAPVEGGRPLSVTPLPVTRGDGAPESFTLTFAAEGVTLAADDDNGLRHGLIALAQMLDGARTAPQTLRFPIAGRIADRPRHGWRGCMLDASRQFWQAAEVLRFLDIMAWYRLNLFHWHLTDDEGWRIEIPDLPELTGIGAFRAPGTSMPPQLGDGIERAGGFYTQTEIRAIVTHAAALGIEILPEVDMPGHCTAVLRALPELCDPDETPASYASVQGFANNALNPAIEATWDFVAKVLDTLVDLFPCRLIHVGGDEVASNAWLGSPKARALMQREGLPGTFELQSWFLRRLQGMLTERGRSLAGWNEVAHGGGVAAENTLLFAWQAPEYGLELAAEGYDVVMTPGQAYYLDMSHSANWYEPGAGWAGSSSAEHSYSYEAATAFPPELAHRLKGVQACIWSEHMHDRAYFNDLVFPRLLAVAEAAWTPAEGKSWPRFAALAKRHPLL